MASKSVWLVTGASQGLGLELALAALKAGHYVLGTARRPEKAEKDYPEFSTLGGHWLQLDVTDANVEEVVSAAIQKAGRIDVLCNNAGYTMVGTVEDMSIDELRSQFDTNIYGVVRVTKAAIPRMRAQKSGTIINIGSVLGQQTLAALSAYSMSKFALEGLSEALALELRDFGVRVVHVSAGYYRTRIFNAGQIAAAGFTDAYLSTRLGAQLGTVQKMTEDPTHLAGDPTKYGKVIVDIVDGGSLAGAWDTFLHLPMGKDAVEVLDDKIKRMKDSVHLTRAIASSTDFDDYDESRRLLPADEFYI